MIHLQKDSTNVMVLVTDDMVIIDDPVYLWRFVHDVTNREHLIELDNELKDNLRADKFSLTLPDDLPNFQDGIYHYYVYESATAGDEDFENMRLLATGRADLNTEFAQDKVYERTGEDKVYKGYNS